MRGLGRLQRLVLGVTRVTRQTRDENFIGFDKYRRHGAYHWHALQADECYQTKAALLTTFLSPDSVCLDLGCGDGAYVYALSRSCRRVVGIDADFDAVRLARQRLAQHGVRNTTCLQASFRSVVEGTVRLDAPFDVVYSMDVIEHLPDPRELLRACCALVRPSGAIVIGTPLFLSSDLISPYHVKEYSVHELRTLLGEYVTIREERLLSSGRIDGQVHAESFYIGIGVAKDHATLTAS